MAVGTDTQGGHVWVITRASATRTTFWESLSGVRTTHELSGVDDTARTAHYRTIGCIFNHESFYANVQADDSVEACVFDLENGRHWKAMQPSLIRALTPMPAPVLASHMGSDAGMIEQRLEAELRKLIRQHRESLGLATIWDTRLQHYLAPALAAYEAERLMGVAYGNEEFQQAIKRHVPEVQALRATAPCACAHPAERPMPPRACPGAHVQGISPAVCPHVPITDHVHAPQGARRA